MQASAEPAERAPTGVPSKPAAHRLCQKRLDYALRKSSYVRYMLDAMKRLGCDVQVDRHLVCEPCGPTVAGGFDPEAKQVGTAPWGYSGVVI